LHKIVLGKTNGSINIILVGLWKQYVSLTVAGVATGYRIRNLIETEKNIIRMIIPVFPTWQRIVPHSTRWWRWMMKMGFNGSCGIDGSVRWR
jgi:hypothetical protein